MNTPLSVGQRVTYVDARGKLENGIVKSLSDENHVFVVYNCCEDWDKYYEYTAARTATEDLVLGWRQISPR